MTMQAIVLDDAGLRLARVASPVAGVGEVIIDVLHAGVCRTDLAVADGRIAVAASRVLGHEFSGRVSAIGDGVVGPVVGDVVTVIPFGACGRCAGGSELAADSNGDARSGGVARARPPVCSGGERCRSPWWLGIDRDGAFAERVAVPAACVVGLPASLSLVHGAFVEPVAAALGSLPFVARGARVLVAGAGRIAELSARVLAAHGASVVRHDADRPPRGAFDVIVEHGGDPAPLLAMLRPGGTLVLKSRARGAVTLDPGELVARDLVVRGASHGSFVAAVDWLHAGRIAVDDLLAPPQPLAAYREVFAAARDEQRKQMFAIGAGG